MGSELYERGIPLFSKEDNYELYSFRTLFNDKQIQEYETRAIKLNEEQRGDSAVFYLYKK